MKLGVYTAILHDKPLREALEVIASLGLTGAEINAGGFLPTPHLPVDDLLSGDGHAAASTWPPSTAPACRSPG